jgi:hypothetical protein
MMKIMPDMASKVNLEPLSLGRIFVY